MALIQANTGPLEEDTMPNLRQDRINQLKAENSTLEEQALGKRPLIPTPQSLSHYKGILANSSPLYKTLKTEALLNQDPDLGEALRIAAIKA